MSDAAFATTEHPGQGDADQGTGRRARKVDPEA